MPLALSYTLAIVASMGVALTVSPALALTLLRGVPIERRSSPLVAWLQKVYSAGLSRVIRRPVAAYLTFALVTLAGVAVYPHLGQSLFPGFKERMCDEKGDLRRFVNVYVGEEDIRFMNGLDTAIPDGESVSIIPAVAGGR